MFVLVFGLSLCLASVLPSVESSCSDEPCQSYPNALSPDTSGGDPSEERVLTELLCYLECLGAGEVLIYHIV